MAIRKKAVRKKATGKKKHPPVKDPRGYKSKLGYLDRIGERAILWPRHCDHTIDIVTLRAPDGTDQLVASQAHQHVARNANNNARPESLCWKNLTTYHTCILFTPERWPFSNPYTVITLPAGAQAGPFTIYAGAGLGGHDYKITPQPLSKAGPPGTPEVIVD